MYTLKHEPSGAYLISLNEYTFDKKEALKMPYDKAEFYRIYQLKELDLKLEPCKKK